MTRSKITSEYKGLPRAHNPFAPKGHGRHGRWQFLTFGTSAMMHVVPCKLVEAIIADMESRGAALTSRKNVESFYMDSGGMMFAGRPVTSVRFNGIKFEMPAEDVRHFLAQIASLPERKTADGMPYWKAKGFFQRALVLGPGDKTSILRALREKLQAAEAEAAAFYHGRKPINQALADANNAFRAPEDRVRAEDVGDDPHARFRSRGAKA